MVVKCDNQQAMKPPAFDQDDHARSQHAALDLGQSTENNGQVTWVTDQT